MDTHDPFLPHVLASYLPDNINDPWNVAMQTGAPSLDKPGMDAELNPLEDFPVTSSAFCVGPGSPGSMQGIQSPSHGSNDAIDDMLNTFLHSGVIPVKIEEPIMLPTSPASTGTSPSPPPAVAAPAPTRAAPRGRKAKPEKKKTAHNLIERKYRNSINDRLAELKSLLPLGDNTKMQKAAILRKAIEYIGFLRKSNEKLTSENTTLRSKLATFTGSAAAVNSLLASSPSPTPTATPSSAPNSPSPSVYSAPSPSPSSGSSGSDGESPKGYRAGGNTRLMVCMLLVGVCFFAPGPTNMGVTSHTGARVLNSVEPTTHSNTLYSDVAYWGLRSMLCLIGLLIIFVRDPISETESALARAAQEHQKKCSAAMDKNDRSVARQHAQHALECVGRPWPSTRTDLWMSIASQFVRQALHLVWVGEWFDQLMASRDSNVQTSTGIAAVASHHLHQIMMQETGSSDARQNEGMQRALAAITAVNMAETAPDNVDAYVMTRIYVAAALQVKISLNSPLARVYLSKARQSYRSCADRSGDLAWLFQSDGYDFFTSGKWVNQAVVKADGTKLVAGTIQHLGVAFRLHLMQQTVEGFINGKDTELVEQWLHDLRQYSVQAKDSYREWWALMGLVAINWRQGKNFEARGIFVNAEKLTIRKTRLQEAVYAAFRGHQALLDGDHALCWSACERASVLLREEPDAACRDFESLAHGARNIAFRHLLSSRVALYRVRRYLHDTTKAQLPLIEGSNGSPVTFPIMLEKAQADVGTLRKFSDSYPAVEPQIFMYQAICRCLAGGRLAPTEHLFHQSVKAARRLNLPYDEALALWHTSSFLRMSLTPKTLRDNLQRAQDIFQDLQASTELNSTRKMLKLVELN